MSIEKIAQLAGVSKATVSLVMNNRGCITEKTSQRVRDAATTLGYTPKRRPTSSARRAAKPTTRIGLFFLGGKRGVEPNMPVYSEFLSLAQKEITRAGASTMLTQLDSPEAIPGFAREVDGILAIGAREPFRELLTSAPSVICMGSRPEIDLDHVSYDDRLVGELAARRLLDGGDKRVAVITSSRPGKNSTYSRVDAFIAAIEASGTKPLCFSDSTVMQTVRQQVVIDNAALARYADDALKQGCTGFFVTDDLLAVPLYFLLYQRGLRPMRDVRIVSCNNTASLLQTLTPRPPTVDIRLGAIACKAVAQLLWRMKNPKMPSCRTLFDPILIDPDTVTKE